MYTFLGKLMSMDNVNRNTAILIYNIQYSLSKSKQKYTTYLVEERQRNTDKKAIHMYFKQKLFSRKK